MHYVLFYGPELLCGDVWFLILFCFVLDILLNKCLLRLGIPFQRDFFLKPFWNQTVF